MRTSELSEIRADEEIEWRWLRADEYANVRWWPLPEDADDRECEACSQPATRIADFGWAGLFLWCDTHSPDTTSSGSAPGGAS
jgi:hypothetical protein